MTTNHETDELLTTEDVAKIVRVPVSTVRYWQHRGSGPSSFRMGKRRLYARSDVEAWIARAREAAMGGDAA